MVEKTSDAITTTESADYYAILIVSSWERANCQANDIDVICGDLQRNILLLPLLSTTENMFEKVW